MARNRAIGLDGGMPWHLPGELKHFKNTTMGKPIVMGRKTWQSVGVALPGRQSLVVTRNVSFKAEGCEVVGSLAEAIDKANGPEVMIIGGGQLYAQVLPLADRMVLTLVDCEPQADTRFPEWREDEWQQVGSRVQPADEQNSCAYQVLDLLRRNITY